jgi:hypothetical protein
MNQEMISIDLPSDRYTLLDGTRDGLPEIVVVNEALLDFPHADVFPWYLRVRLYAEDLGEHGMPTRRENRILLDVGERIEEVVLGSSAGARNALFLARSTWNEARDLHFYVRDPELARTALQTLLDTEHHERSWDFALKHDAQWREAESIFHLFERDQNDL